MKSLVVYFSRTGTTKKVAEAISKKLKADSEEIKTTDSRDGILVYLKSGKEASLKRPADIDKTKKDPSKYDVVVIGTPVWAWSVSSPVRAYLMKNRDKLKKAEFAFFCTQSGSGAERACSQMEDLCRKKPLSVLWLKEGEVLKADYRRKADDFTSKITKIRLSR